MNNRISGDFGNDALEAFRAAYAQREVKPEDLEVDQYTGLPTGEITNISPWIQHTGLWRANPGTDRGFVPNQVLETEEDFEDGLNEEDFDRMVDEVLSDLEEEDRFANEIYNSTDEDEEEGIEDAELEALIDSLLSEREEDEQDVSEGESNVEVPSEDEIDALIQEIMGEIEAEEEAEEAEASKNREISNDELEDMISDLEPEVDAELELGEPGTKVDEVADNENYDEIEETQGDKDSLESNEGVVSDDEIDNLVDEILGEEGD